MRRLSVLAGAALLTLTTVGCGNKASFTMDAGSSMSKSMNEFVPSKAGPETNVGQGMVDKFCRGVVDTFTGIVEWPMQTYKGWNRGMSFIKHDGTSKTVGAVVGLIWTGPVHAICRTGSGLGEIFGFWLPNPADNKDIGSQFDAKYSWEDGKAMGLFVPTVNDGLHRWGNKFVRGLGNGVGAIVEIPGQIKKGINKGGSAIGVGIVKGFWFAFGRFNHGLGEAFTFFLPNHSEQMGYGFEEKWPWDALVQ